MIINEDGLLEELTLLLKDALSDEDVKRINGNIAETLRQIEMDKTE